MALTRMDERFFDSTRGRIVTLLRGTTRTVNQLMEELSLTDNAVRAQLLSLERDGLVRQSGIERGHRKPHFSYQLTAEAERLFPKAYDRLLNQLITVLKGKLSEEFLDETLREVGRSLASLHATSDTSGTIQTRAEIAAQVMNALGGAARVEEADGTISIRSGSCPLAGAVAEHPEVCRLAEALVAEITGGVVQEHCDRSEPPRCNFEISS
ncbi:MAG TPA: ArsR family transcriptional regulator [Pyrinomonadaceae bacterium]